jgi:hypothetical protein
MEDPKNDGMAPVYARPMLWRSAAPVLRPYRSLYDPCRLPSLVRVDRRWSLTADFMAPMGCVQDARLCKERNINVG